MRKFMKFGWLVMAMAMTMAFPACSDDDDDNPSSPGGGELGTDIEVRVSALEETVRSLESVKESLGQIEGMQGKIGELQGLIEGLNGSISAIKEQSDANKSSVEGINTQIQDILKTLGSLSGFEDGANIKEYIDEAVKNASSSLGSYVLKEEYDEFYEKYSAFMGDYQGKVKDILDSIAEIKGQGTAMDERVSRLESELKTLEEEVKSPFDATSQDFLNGVNSVIAKALEEGGAISVALQKELDALREEYDKKISELEARIGKLEGTVTGLLERIQSLVYVPETSDGKIHIGTSYISVDNVKNSVDSVKKIEVTSKKILKYRVSPANLRDSLLTYLLPEEYTFWQEHVSRVQEASRNIGLVRREMKTRAEGHDGPHEFYILKVEAGNNGELLITVDNEHDFTHEDLAVALCIRHEDEKSGVLTEYVSPYTTVVGDGENIAGRFYIAKEEADGWKISRDNVVEYMRNYNDYTPVALMEGYEVVYDDGEEVVPFEEAKEKFGWDADLTGQIMRARRGTGINGSMGEDQYIITPSDYKTNFDSALTFQLKDPGNEANVGNSWVAYYNLAVKNGNGDSINVVPQITARVEILPKKYEVPADVVWNSDKWNYGKRQGWKTESATYISSAAKLTYDGRNVSDLPEDAVRDLFDGKQWNPVTDDNEIQKDGSLDITTTMRSGSLVFLIKGFKYCEGEDSIKLEMKNEEVKVSATLKFIGPGSREVDIKNVEMPTDPNDESYKYQTNGTDYPLIYLSANSQYPENKKLPYTEDEINKFFDGDEHKVMHWMTYAVHFGALTLEGDSTCRKTAENGTAPQTVTLELIEKGGRPVPTLPVVYVKSDEGIKSLQEDCTYQIPDGLKIKVTDGPVIPLKGTFTFKAKK